MLRKDFKAVYNNAKHYEINDVLSCPTLGKASRLDEW